MTMVEEGMVIVYIAGQTVKSNVWNNNNSVLGEVANYIKALYSIYSKIKANFF